MQTHAESVEEIMDAVGRLVRSVRREPLDGIEHAEFWVLSTLVEQGLRPTAIAERTLLNPSTVSRHVDALERKGYAERTPDPGDGRARLVTLTQEGRAVVERTKARRRRRVTDELSTWDPTDVERLRLLVGRLADNVTTTIRQEDPRA